MPAPSAVNSMALSCAYPDWLPESFRSGTRDCYFVQLNGTVKDIQNDRHPFLTF